MEILLLKSPRIGSPAISNGNGKIPWQQKFLPLCLLIVIGMVLILKNLRDTLNISAAILLI